MKTASIVAQMKYVMPSSCRTPGKRRSASADSLEEFIIKPKSTRRALRRSVRRIILGRETDMRSWVLRETTNVSPIIQANLFVTRIIEVDK